MGTDKLNVSDKSTCFFPFSVYLSHFIISLIPNVQIFKKVQIYEDGKMEKTFQKWQVQKEEQKIDVLYRWQKDELSSDVGGENEK